MHRLIFPLAKAPAFVSGYLSEKLKPWHIHGTAGTHCRSNPGTLAMLCPQYPQPQGGGVSK